MTEQLKNILSTHKVETISNIMRWEKYKSIKEEINILTVFLDVKSTKIKISERIYCINNSIIEPPKCKICDNYARFITTGIGYSDGCCLKCANKYASIKRSQTLFNRYGYYHALHRPEFMEKAKATCLKNHGVDNIFKNTEYMREKTFEKTGYYSIFENSAYIQQKFMEKYGVKGPYALPETFEKSKRTCLERYGYEYSFQSENNKNKTRETNIKKYGVPSVMQNEIIKAKCFGTCLKNHGVDNPMKSPEIREKTYATNIIRYGVPFLLQLDERKTIMGDTMYSRYGYRFSMQVPHIKEKSIRTSLEKYGVEYPMQSNEIYDKVNFYKPKEYILPSGRKINLQGYEPKALDELLEKYNETDIKTYRGEMPAIWYIKNNKKHRYYPDFYIPKDNLIIEVKSGWTMQKDFFVNMLKAHYTKKMGYKFKFMVFEY